MSLALITEIIICTSILIGLIFAIKQHNAACKALAQEKEALRQVEKVGKDPDLIMQALWNSGRETETTRILTMAYETGNYSAENLSFYDFNHLARYLAGIFVFIGLLGTVLSIAVSIGSLERIVSASTLGISTHSASSQDQYNLMKQQQSQGMDGLARLLSGILWASICTLGGLLATIFTSAFNTHYLRACQAHENDLRRLADGLALLQRQRAANPNALIGVVTTLSGAAGELKTTISHLLKSTNELSTHIGEIKTIHNNSSSLAERLTGTAEALKQAFEDIDRERQGLESMSDTVSAAARSMAGQVELLRNDMVKETEVQRGYLNTTVESISKTQEALRNLLRDFEKVLNDVTAISETSLVRQEIMGLKSELTNTITRMGSRLQDSQQKLQDSQKQICEEVANSSRAMTRSLSLSPEPVLRRSPERRDLIEDSSEELVTSGSPRERPETPRARPYEDSRPALAVMAGSDKKTKRGFRERLLHLWNRFGRNNAR